MNGDSILLVEDDKEIRQGVEIFLRSQGYQVFQAENGLEGLKILEERPIDLAIVDVMMPVMDGITMTAKLREKYDFPVIFLSAKTEEVDKILGLNIGADDYVTKPFSPREIVFRIKAQLRRQQYQSSTQSNSNDLLTVGTLTLDKESSRIYKAGQEIELTGREFFLLSYLMENANKIISKERLYEQVWGEYSSICDNTIMVHIRHIREKIEDTPSSPTQLVTVKGLGYKLKKRTN